MFPFRATVRAMANALKALRELRGWTHHDAADAMGMSRAGYIKLERGERKLHEKTIAAAARAFGVAPKVILGDESFELATGHRPVPEFLGERDLKVYAAVEGGPGVMVVSTDPIELVPRPWYMREVRDGYAVLVVGESMVPAFKPGDMAIVNPRLPPLRGQDVILIGGEQTGEFRASIKHLEGWDVRAWKLRQYNPPRGEKAELNWPRRDWPKALRVVGKYYGG
jgi:transcriptional regulator with XRE-family HTH domain